MTSDAIQTDCGLNVGDSPTLSVAATQAGVILGTAAYMSPEQARGKPVDRRTDIWSFGSVLFEILAGKRPFQGETVSDTLAAILKSDPDWNVLPADIPPRIRELTRRCLRKDPKQRLQAIGEARIAIEETIHDTGAIYESPQSAAAKPLLQSEGKQRLTMRPLPWPAAAILLVGLSTLGGWWFGGRQTTPPPRWVGDLMGGSSVAYDPRLSPDGRHSPSLPWWKT